MKQFEKLLEEKTTKIRNWVNYDYETDSTHEPENKLPSMTVPDLSLSVKDIVDRINMGLPPEGERLPIFDEHSPLPDISRMDLADRQKFIKHYEDEINRLLTPQQATESVMAQLQNDKKEQETLKTAYEDTLVKD